MPESQRRPTLRSYTSGNAYFYTAIAIGVIMLVVSAILGGYKASLVEKIGALDGQMLTEEKARNKDQEKQLVAASQQSRIMKQLLASKVYWSQALQRMQQMMQASVSLTNLDASLKEKKITFKATADTYAAVARQIAAFVAATGVNDVAVGTVKINQRGTIEFDGTLQIDTKALLFR